MHFHALRTILILPWISLVLATKNGDSSKTEAEHHFDQVPDYRDVGPDSKVTKVIVGDMMVDKNEDPDLWQALGLPGNDNMKRDLIAEKMLTGTREVGGIWPGGKLCYSIDPNADFSGAIETAIREAMKMIEEKSCVRFIESKCTSGYVNITAGKVSASQIGWHQNGVRELTIGTDGEVTKGDVAHELMHALGFIHEHQRDDRDYFVKISPLLSNVLTYMKAEKFRKIVGLTYDTLNIPYDYKSIMHLPFGFAIKKIPDGDDSMIPGQREQLSNKDVCALNRLYGCHQKINQLTNNGLRCDCLNSFSDEYCEKNAGSCMTKGSNTAVYCPKTCGKCLREYCPWKVLPDITGIGCFSNPQNKVLLFSMRRSIKWKQWKTWMPAALCKCALTAKRRRLKFFGLKFYGECYGMKGDINLDSLKSSEKCADLSYNKNTYSNTEPMAGTSGTMYLYKFL